MRAILTLISAAALAACNGTTAPVTSDFDSLPADQVLYGSEHITSVDGVRRANLKSDTTLIFKDSTAVHVRGVELEMYDENGQVRATLTSASGTLDQNTQRMVARGNVILIVAGAQGRTVWTEELYYDPQTKRIWSDVTTRSRTAAGQEFTGDGFTSDDTFRNFNITRPRGDIRFSF